MCACSSSSLTAVLVRSEEPERAVLWRDDRHVELHLHIGCAGRRHQRDLIQRQLPRHPPWRDERETVDVAPSISWISPCSCSSKRRSSIVIACR